MSATKRSCSVSFALVGYSQKRAQFGFNGLAVLEWECALKHRDNGTREGIANIRDHTIRPTPYASNNFAVAEGIELLNQKMQGMAKS
jgi:hypothetical protein